MDEPQQLTVAVAQVLGKALEARGGEILGLRESRAFRR
jgi:hypothetical protein